MAFPARSQDGVLVILRIDSAAKLWGHDCNNSHGTDEMVHSPSINCQTVHVGQNRRALNDETNVSRRRMMHVPCLRLMSDVSSAGKAAAMVGPTFTV